MGITNRMGYDESLSPCDTRYAPPEQFIEEKEWAKFDVYCVGLILVRTLFPPLWSGEQFNEFSDSFHVAGCELDTWLTRYETSLSLLNKRDNARERKKERETWLDQSLPQVDQSLPLALEPRGTPRETDQNAGAQNNISCIHNNFSMRLSLTLKQTIQTLFCQPMTRQEIINSRIHNNFCVCLSLTLKPTIHTNIHSLLTARDQAYVDLAQQSCGFPHEESPRSRRQQDMCAQKEGIYTHTHTHTTHTQNTHTKHTHAHTHTHTHRHTLTHFSFMFSPDTYRSHGRILTRI